MIAVALAYSGTLPQLAGTTNVLLLLVFFSVNVSLVVLKASDVRAQRTRSGFRTPMPVAVLGAATCLLLIGFLPHESLFTASLLIGLGIALVGIWAWRRRGR